MKGAWCGSNERLVSRNSSVSCSPLALTRLPSLTVQPASLSSCRRLAQQLAILAGAVGHRRHEWRPEHLSGTWPRNGSSSATSSGDGWPCAIMSEFWNAECVRCIGAVHQVLVGPFEVEGDRSTPRERALSPNFSRRVLMQPALRAGGAFVGDDSPLDASVLERREIVARRPDARGELLAEQIVLAGEALEARLRDPGSTRSARYRNCTARAKPAGFRPTSS